MKKFKSLMLAAIATAALAATASAMGHEKGESTLGLTKISGEVNVEVKYTSQELDSDNGASTVFDTEIGDVNITFGGNNYKFQIERDDEDADLNTNLTIFGKATEGDNYVEASGTIEEVFMPAGDQGAAYGDVFIKGGNKGFSLKVGKFGNTSYYSNGMGVARGSVAGFDEEKYVQDGEAGLLIEGFRGFQLDVNAGDLNVNVALPIMDNNATAVGDYNMSLEAGGTTDDVNITGFRPALEFSNKQFSLAAVYYTLAFENQKESEDDVFDKSDSGFQVMANAAVGPATIGGGYTTRTVEDLTTNSMFGGETYSNDSGTEEEATFNGINGFVTVGLGGGMKAGASFDVLNFDPDLEIGGEDAAVTTTRFSGSLQMPFFVDAVTMKLGVGVATADSDVESLAGTETAMQATWGWKL